MFRRVGSSFFAIVLLLSLGPAYSHVAAAASCTSALSATVGNLCIIEVQTVGASGSEEEDYVILSNPTALLFAPSNVRLQYINSQGVLDSSLAPGSFAPGETKTFVSGALKPVNVDAGNLTLPLASSGGSLRLVRLASGASSNIIATYDQIGWGDTSISETIPVPPQADATSFVRKNNNGALQDTDNNSLDFDIHNYDCSGSVISEVQPFVTDNSGSSINAWVELLGITEPTGDCTLLTGAGDIYNIAASDMPGPGELFLIDSGMDAQNQLVPLHIGDAAGQVWIAASSYYVGIAAVHLPLESTSYTNLAKGQSWALVGGLWRRTYAMTPGDTNQYQANLENTVDDPLSCSTVVITELLPNPTGDDAGNEWVEVYNDSDDPASLGGCMVDVAGTSYNFLPDDVLGPHEWRATASLYTSEGDTKALSLRNSGDTQVSLLRMSSNGNETLQSFIYSDAPEGETWARFDDGWQWTYEPSPDAPNILIATPPTPQVTEFAAGGEQSGGRGGVDGVELTATPYPLTITELLPNPAAPQTDENDEFIELFNPTTEPVDLDSYKVQTGTNYTYSFTLDKLSIPAGGYLVITSGSTGLTLSNSAGRARLLDPAGNLVYETDAYVDASEGVSWAYIDGKWQWTNTPTPNVANVYTASGSTSAKTAKKTTTTKTATAKKTTPTVKAAKTAKPKTKNTASSTTGSEETKAPLHGAVIAVVGGLAVLYGVYEYRGDVANWFYRLKRNRANRRANRT